MSVTGAMERIYAVHLKQNDATYSGEWEFFASGTPLAVTDIVAGHDGALYFATGGRGNQSNIYRITHKMQTPLVVPPEISGMARQRQKISALNGDPKIIDYHSLASSLRSSDRTLRYATREPLLNTSHSNSGRRTFSWRIKKQHFSKERAPAGPS